MKTFICFALFIAAAAASVIPIGGPIGTSISGPIVANISPLGLSQQQVVVNSPLGLGLGLGATKIIGGGLPINAGLLGLGGLGLSSLQVASPLGLGLGLGGQIISPLNGGLIVKG